MSHVQEWMLTKLGAEIISHWIQVSNHHVVYPKLLQCHVSAIAQKKRVAGGRTENIEHIFLRKKNSFELYITTSSDVGCRARRRGWSTEEGGGDEETGTEEQPQSQTLTGRGRGQRGLWAPTPSLDLTPPCRLQATNQRVNHCSFTRERKKPQNTEKPP